MRSLVSAVLLVLALAACGGGGGGGGDEDAGDPSAETTPSEEAGQSAEPASEPPAEIEPTDAAPAGATVEQFAALVAQYEPTITEAIDSALACGLPAPVPEDDFNCGFVTGELSFAASDLLTALKNATDESSPEYLGPEPPETVDLVTRTGQAASATDDIVPEVGIRCLSDATAVCQESRDALVAAMSELQAALAAWDSYR